MLTIRNWYDDYDSMIYFITDSTINNICLNTSYSKQLNNSLYFIIGNKLLLMLIKPVTTFNLKFDY